MGLFFISLRQRLSEMSLPGPNGPQTCFKKENHPNTFRMYQSPEGSGQKNNRDDLAERERERKSVSLTLNRSGARHKTHPTQTFLVFLIHGLVLGHKIGNDDATETEREESLRASADTRLASLTSALRLTEGTEGASTLTGPAAATGKVHTR